MGGGRVGEKNYCKGKLRKKKNNNNAYRVAQQKSHVLAF